MRLREIEISIIWRKVFVLMSLQWQISFSDGVVTADFAEIAKKSAATRPARVRVTLTLTLTLALSHCTQPIQSPWDVNPSSQKTSPDQSSHQDERKTRKDPHGSTSDRCGPCTHRSRYGTLQPASHLERSCGLRCHEQPLLQHKARTCQKVIPHRHCAPDLGCFSSCAVLA